MASLWPTLQGQPWSKGFRKSGDGAARFGIGLGREPGFKERLAAPQAARGKDVGMGREERQAPGENPLARSLDRCSGAPVCPSTARPIGAILSP